MKSRLIDQSFATNRSGRKLALAWSSTESAPEMLKVAFATADRISVNQHFGATLGFAIYAIDGEHARLIEATEYPPEAMDGNENKLAEKIASLQGCAAVYCLAVGGSAVRQLLASGIQPVRLESETSIESVLTQLRKAVREGGIAWVDKRINRDSDTARFDRMLAEGWQE